jgi:hypothetical protein
MSVVVRDEMVSLINDLLLEASETGNYVSSGYSAHMSEIDDMLVFGEAVASELNAIVEHLDYSYILLKRNNIFVKIDWSIDYDGEVDMTIQANISPHF